MEQIKDLMIELDGADPETVNRIAWEKGSLPVRLAMLGLASIRKGDRPLWWGYPPGVFISYKWNGAPMRDLVLDLAGHIRERGYRAFLDVENLDEEADAYFQIPQFITSVQDCTFYVLLLTELAADLMTGRKGRTTWIHDEHQHAVRLTNSGMRVGTKPTKCCGAPSTSDIRSITSFGACSTRYIPLIGRVSMLYAPGFTPPTVKRSFHTYTKGTAPSTGYQTERSSSPEVPKCRKPA